MLQNAYLLAKIGADTAENEQHFAEICQKLATTLRACSGIYSLKKRWKRLSTAAERMRSRRYPAEGWNVPRRPALEALPDPHDALRRKRRWMAYPRGSLEGSFSAVSKPNFPSKYAFESSRRDLHNALLCTALKSHFF